MTKQAQKKAADPHAAQKAKLAETLLAQHSTKGAKREGCTAAAIASAVHREWIRLS
jgi:hypothetical protein